MPFIDAHESHDSEQEFQVGLIPFFRNIFRRLRISYLRRSWIKWVVIGLVTLMLIIMGMGKVL